MKPTVQNFRLWLNGKFMEGKVNNISQTEWWIDCFIKECDADHESKDDDNVKGDVKA
jgi:hypothetical protein